MLRRILPAANYIRTHPEGKFGSSPYTLVAVWTFGMDCFGRLCLSFVGVHVGSGYLVGPAGGELFIKVQSGGLRSGWNQGVKREQETRVALKQFLGKYSTQFLAWSLAQNAYLLRPCDRFYNNYCGSGGLSPGGIRSLSAFGVLSE